MAVPVMTAILSWQLRIKSTIYATPHYLDGVVVYCLEHKYPGPGERDGDDDYEPTGPYTIVDLAGYKTTPGLLPAMYSQTAPCCYCVGHSSLLPFHGDR